MKKPDIPKDEESRLQSLKSLNILDTPPEERFDRLTRIANKLFGVPIALVSLIDENRQWFKSSFGLNVTETSRDISFCGHAILGDDIFVISDTKKDKRFSDNPLVLSDPNIRFYAGCPLRTRDGSKLGTICIIDREPRNLKTHDKNILKDLAAMVERELELEQLVIVDELTKISNRSGFMMFAEQSINFSRRKGLPATLVFFDLNKFKIINDTYGHAEGDKALTIFADNIKKVARGSDIFARLSGDEFVILFSDTSKEFVEQIIRRFKENLEKLKIKAGIKYDLSFSYGIVEYDFVKHKTVKKLLDDADQLMYKHKNANKQV